MKGSIRITVGAVLAVAAAAQTVAAQTTVTTAPFSGDQVRQAVSTLRDSLPFRGAVRYYLRVRSDTAHSLTVLETSLDEGVADALAEAIAKLPADTAGPGGKVFLLSVEVADSVILTSEPARVQRPEPWNQKDVQRELGELAGSLPPGTRVSIWLFVDKKGHVSRSRISRGTGSDVYDARIAEVARRLRFTPAKVNGRHAMAAWVEIPFHINTGGQ